MPGHNTLAMYDTVFPLIAPVDLGSTATETPYIDLLGVNKCAFLLMTGVTTPNATSDIIDVTLDACSVESGGAETQLTFQYRKSGIVSANTWGAVTLATATGAELTDDDEGMSLWIEVDVDALAASKLRYVKLHIEQNAFTVFLAACVAFVSHRYHMTTQVSVTASASA
jgi:hypothetical protein